MSRYYLDNARHYLVSFFHILIFQEFACKQQYYPFKGYYNFRSVEKIYFIVTCNYQLNLNNKKQPQYETS